MQEVNKRKYSLLQKLDKWPTIMPNNQRFFDREVQKDFNLNKPD